jgi:hypothetical protein
MKSALDHVVVDSVKAWGRDGARSVKPRMKAARVVAYDSLFLALERIGGGGLNDILDGS